MMPNLRRFSRAITCKVEFLWLLSEKSKIPFFAFLINSDYENRQKSSEEPQKYKLW